jgi:hypothetical protein
MTLYSGGSEWSIGCWKPAALQLPSREIQVFFAGEAPYRESDKQEIIPKGSVRLLCYMKLDCMSPVPLNSHKSY